MNPPQSLVMSGIPSIRSLNDSAAQKIMRLPQASSSPPRSLFSHPQPLSHQTYVLNRSIVLQGFVFPRGSEFRTVDGRLREIILSEDIHVLGITYPKASKFEFDLHGKATPPWGILERDGVFLGIPCAAGSQIRLLPGRQTLLAKLGKDFATQGEIYPKHSTAKFENGVLKSVKLARDSVIRGINFPENSSLDFFSGQLRARLSQNRNIQGRACVPGELLVFDVGGRLLEARPERSGIILIDE